MKIFSFSLKATKSLVLNMCARLRTPGRVKTSLKRQLTSTQQSQSPESNSKILAREKVSTSFKRWCGEFHVPKTSDVYLPICRRPLLSPYERYIKEKRQEAKFKPEEARAKRKELKEDSAEIRDPASRTADKSARIICVTGHKTLPSGRMCKLWSLISFVVFCLLLNINCQNFEFWLADRTCHAPVDWW